jgi:hypothetical protein
MRGVQDSADRAIQLARIFLAAREPGSKIHDVQSDPRFQHRGVDLLWEPPQGPIRGIEVKGDRNGRRGNYFFELVSNFERNTPGCFLYSTAEVYLYVFLEEREVHPLPLADTRAWFRTNAKQFPIKHTRTSIGPHSYTTLGAIVPVRQVQLEVEGASRFLIESDNSVRVLRPPRKASSHRTQARV